MERLTEKDFRAILEFLHTSYSTSNPGEFMNQLLLGLKRFVPCEFSAYCEMDPRSNSSVNRVEPIGAISAQNERTWREYMQEHAVLAYNVRSRDGRAMKISDFDTQQQFHRRGLYNELYRHLGIEDVLCMTLPATSTKVHVLAFSRGRRNFTERERLILNLLRPHLTQARQNARMISHLQDELLDLTEAFDDLKYGVVVLDRSSRPRLITPRARKWFADFFERARPGSRGLLDTVRDWISQRRGLMQGGNLSTPLTPLVVERAGRRLMLHLILNQKRTLILKEINTESEPRRLDHFGLSHRESEVLGWVAEGKTNSEIGTILGISYRTVQKHLEHVFQKIGVETRTAAAARFLEGNSDGGWTGLS